MSRASRQRRGRRRAGRPLDTLRPGVYVVSAEEAIELVKKWDRAIARILEMTGGTVIAFPGSGTTIDMDSIIGKQVTMLIEAKTYTLPAPLSVREEAAASVLSSWSV